MKIQTVLVFIFCLAFRLHGSEFQGGWVVGWGDNVAGEATGVYPFTYTTNKSEMLAQFKNPQLRSATGTVSIARQTLSNVAGVTCGVGYPFAVTKNGNVIGWGWSGAAQSSLPSGLSNVLSVASGQTHALALKNDGTVACWGEKGYGALNMPVGLSNVVAVAACGNNSLALKKDGTLVGWGQSIKIPSGLSNIVAISTSPASRLGIGRRGDALALKQDGTVIHIGWSDSESEASAIGGLSNVVAIAAGPVHSLALKRDGTVYAWGFNGNGELNQPPDLTNVVAIAASGTGFPANGYSLALKRDGSLVTWGGFFPKGYSGSIPEGLSNVVAISAGPGFCLAITTNRAVADRFRQK